MHKCDKVECKHTNITFCPKCRKPYCVDCGMEWEGKCTLNHYPYYYPYYPQWTYTYPSYTTTVAGCLH